MDDLVKMVDGSFRAFSLPRRLVAGACGLMYRCNQFSVVVTNCRMCSVPERTWLAAAAEYRDSASRMQNYPPRWNRYLRGTRSGQALPFDEG